MASPSQTKSNTQRPLMYPDEIMRMDNRECLVLLRGEKPMRLYKIIPDEHPSFSKLRDVKVSDYVPHWRQEAEQPTKAAPPPSPAPPSDQNDPPPMKPAADAPSAASDTVPPLPPPPPQESEPKQEQTPPAQSPGGLGPKYGYGLLDPETDGYDGADPQGAPDQDSPYGAFDLIETLPQDVGGEGQKNQR